MAQQKVAKKSLLFAGTYNFCMISERQIQGEE